MAMTINWGTKIISVPQSDLTLVSGTLYEMDTESYFRTELMALADDEAGMAYDIPYQHNTEVTVAGTTFARTIEIINGYQVQFTPDSQWSVRLTGSNNNIFDVENGVLVQNQVQVIPNNSGGAINLVLVEKLLRNRQYTDPTEGKLKVYNDDNTAVEYEADIYSDSGSTPYDGTQGIERRDRLEPV